VSSLPVPKGITYRDSEDKKRLEGRNGVIQTRYVFDCIDQWTTGSRLTSDTIKELQRLAVNQIYRCAGHFRDGPVLIQDVLHQPPDHTRVNALVEEMCDYVNSTWDSALAIDLASYVMWRINWIHPFFGGNGRTARSAAHLVLCAKLGFLPPGKETMPELIAANRDPYYAALRSADAAWLRGELDFTDMREMLSAVLAEQLLRFYQQATGRTPS
jgi:Fic family protein